MKRSFYSKADRNIVANCISLALFLILPCLAFSQTPPTAIEDEIFTYDSQATSGNLADNDLNPSNSILTYSLITDTNFGDLILQTNGAYTFTPGATVSAVNQKLLYQVCDNFGQCDQDTIRLYVQFQNNAPQANNDYITAESGEPRFGDAETNDFDPDFQTDPVSLINNFFPTSGPHHGSVIFNLDGTFQYTSNTGYIGNDTIRYNNCDACTICDDAFIYITVVGTNDDPTANDSPVYDTNEDTNYSGTVAGLATDPESDPLTFSVLFAPSHGLVIMNANGTFTYYPDQDYFGSDSFMFLACDIVGQCGAAFVHMNVINQNDAPVAGNDIFSTNEDIPSFFGNLATNDTDDTGPPTYTLNSGPSHGVLTLNANGTFTYTPDSNYNGSDSFVVNVCDASLLCTTSTTTINIAPLNDWPVAVNDETFGYEDNPLSGSVANDTDVDGDALTYSLVSAPDTITITIAPNGDFYMVTSPNYAGILDITYQVCDSHGACTTGNLNIEVIEINDDPIIYDDNFSGNEDQIITGDIRTNDIEPDLEPLNYFTTTSPAHGVLVLQPTGGFTYTPDPNWSGTETITFWGCDPCSVCKIGTLTLVVLPVNDAPIASDGSNSVNEDAVLSGNIASLGSDIDSPSLTFSIVNAAAHGSFILSANGNYTYTPQSNYFGTDAITFQVCDGNNACDQGVFNLTINPVNDAPVAADNSTSTNEDTSVSGSVADDSDIDSNTLTYSIITDPMNGTINMLANGSYTYTPDANYNGVDMLTYMVCDDQGGCDAGVLDFVIAPINDAPVAVTDNNVTYQNDQLTGSVASNDSDIDGDDLTFSLLTSPADGDLLFNTDGSYTYTPNLDYSGSDQFTYEVCDPSGLCATGTVNLTIFTTNTAPIAANSNYNTQEDIVINDNLLSNVTDSEGGVMDFTITSGVMHGTLQLNIDGSFTYTPNPNYFGSDSFSYEVCDTGNMCDGASVSINIASVNDAPTVTDDEGDTLEDQPQSGNVSTNDSDNDNEILVYSIVTGPVNGSINLLSNGNYTYTPNANFFGIETITYQACDPQNACTSGILTMYVIAINDQPVAENVTFTINEDSSLAESVSDNASDIEDAVLTFTSFTTPTTGTFVMQNNGDFTFTPNANYNGTTVINYSACDSEGYCDLATITINVAAINDNPVAANDAATLNEDNSFSGNLNTNDADADNNALSYSIITNTQNGTLILNANGTFTYTPNANYFGPDNAVINVCDPSNACVQTTLTFTIVSVDDAPVAVDDSFNTTEDNPVSGSVKNNDDDIDDFTFTFNIIDAPQYGNLVLNNDGTFTYTPFDNVSGTDVITYSICDGSQCDEATLTISVAPVNDAPVGADEYVHVQEDTFGTGDLSANDYDVDNETLIYSVAIDALHGTFEMTAAGSYTYTPVLNYWGLDSVTYVLCDGAPSCQFAKIIFEVDFINDAPIVADEFIQVIINSGATGDLSDNETELDNEVLTYFVLEDNSGGTFTLNENGTYSYVPNEGVTGTFTVVYYACDPCSICDQGVITIYVVPKEDANTPPTATTISNNICNGSGLEIDMATFVADGQESDYLLNFEFTQPSSGLMLFDAESQMLSYQSFDNVTGSDIIYYTVCDNGLINMCAQDSILITFNADVPAQLEEYVIQPVLCFGDSNGGIDLITLSGGDNYTYAWQGGENTQDLSNLEAGHYVVTINHDGPCAVAQTFEFDVLQPDAALTANIGTSTNISDAGNGAIDLVIEGGTGAYDVLWTGPNAFSSSDEDIVDLTTDGDYTAFIHDANACATSVSTTITGISERNTQIGLAISPNPVGSQLNLKISNTHGESLSYRIIDATGKLVVSKNLGVCGNKTVRIDSNAFASGVYQLQVITNSGMQSMSFVKE